MGSIEKLEDTIKIISTKFCDSLVKYIEKTNSAPIESEKLRKEFMIALDLEKETKRFESAFHTIVDYMDRFGSPVELNEIKENWTHACQKFSELACEERIFKDSDIYSSLQDQIGITKNTFDQFFKIGRELYLRNEFEKAADVFFMLGFLNHAYYNVWVSLGLSEQQANHYDQALRAYAMACIMNNDSPEPFLYAADCCLAMNDKYEAELYLNEAVERIEKDSLKFESFGPYVTRIKQLIQ